MKTPALLLLLLTALSLSLPAQDQPSFEIDLGTEAKDNGLSVKTVCGK